jgi:hypothetical protein
MVAILPLIKAFRQGHNQIMFTTYCPGHRDRVLLFPENIERLVNRPDGIELHWRCTCGNVGRELIARAVPRREAAA